MRLTHTYAFWIQNFNASLTVSRLHWYPDRINLWCILLYPRHPPDSWISYWTFENISLVSIGPFFLFKCSFLSILFIALKLTWTLWRNANINIISRYWRLASKYLLINISLSGLLFELFITTANLKFKKFKKRNKVEK